MSLILVTQNRTTSPVLTVQKIAFAILWNVYLCDERTSF